MQLLSGSQTRHTLHNIPIHIQAQPEKNTKASDFPVINPDLCKGCGACVDICPAEAIKLEDGKAIISTEKCKNCNACARVCPAGAIT